MGANVWRRSDSVATGQTTTKPPAPNSQCGSQESAAKADQRSFKRPLPGATDSPRSKPHVAGVKPHGSQLPGLAMTGQKSNSLFPKPSGRLPHAPSHAQPDVTVSHVNKKPRLEHPSRPHSHGTVPQGNHPRNGTAAPPATGTSQHPQKAASTPVVLETKLRSTQAQMEELRRQLKEKEEALAKQREAAAVKEAARAAVQQVAAEAQKRKAQLLKGFASVAAAAPSIPTLNPTTTTSGPVTSAHPAPARPNPAPAATVADDLEVARVLNSKGDYDCLKLHPGAGLAAIRRAYRALAVALHPDKCALEGAADAFQRVNRAYTNLSKQAA